MNKSLNVIDKSCFSQILWLFSSIICMLTKTISLPQCFLLLFNFLLNSHTLINVLYIYIFLHLLLLNLYSTPVFLSFVLPSIIWKTLIEKGLVNWILDCHQLFAHFFTNVYIEFVSTQTYEILNMYCTKLLSLSMINLSATCSDSWLYILNFVILLSS